MEAALLRKFWELPKSPKCLYIVRAFFWVNLLNSFDFVEKPVMGLFRVAELESDLQIWVAHFLGLLAPISAQNFGITQEQKVVREKEPYHRDSRRVLHMEAAFLRTFWTL